MELQLNVHRQANGPDETRSIDGIKVSPPSAPIPKK
jgi:hypothetical protein